MAYQWTTTPVARITANEVGTSNKLSVDGVNMAALQTKYPPAAAVEKINALLDIGGKSVATDGAYITNKLEATDDE